MALIVAIGCASACTPSPSPTAATPVAPTLAALTIDDHPHTDADYNRDAWPHWLDSDHNGCDAREDALLAADPGAKRGKGCAVSAGSWTSAYDGKRFTSASDLDVDHVVALAEAHRSGGWAWSTDQRASYANDQTDLWVVSAASNRSKGDQAPDTWRPPAHESWCLYATRWAAIKVRWHLSATTSERDALAEMMEGCL